MGTDVFEGATGAKIGMMDDAARAAQKDLGGVEQVIWIVIRGLYVYSVDVICFLSGVNFRIYNLHQSSSSRSQRTLRTHDRTFNASRPL